MSTKSSFIKNILTTTFLLSATNNVLAVPVLPHLDIEISENQVKEIGAADLANKYDGIGKVTFAPHATLKLNAVDTTIYGPFINGANGISKLQYGSTANSVVIKDKTVEELNYLYNGLGDCAHGVIFDIDGDFDLLKDNNNIYFLNGGLTTFNFANTKDGLQTITFHNDFKGGLWSGDTVTHKGSFTYPEAGNIVMVSKMPDSILTFQSKDGTQLFGTPDNRVRYLYPLGSGKVIIEGGEHGLDLSNIPAIYLSDNVDFIDKSGTSSKMKLIGFSAYGEVPVIYGRDKSITSTNPRYTLDAKYGDLDILNDGQDIWAYAVNSATVQFQNSGNDPHKITFKKNQ